MLKTLLLIRLCDQVELTDALIFKDTNELSDEAQAWCHETKGKQTGAANHVYCLHTTVLVQRVNRNQAKINAHTSELIGGEGARLYRRENKQTECFLSQIWPSFWPFFSSLHLAV